MTFTDILLEARELVKASESSYTTTSLTASINRGLERTVALIRQADGRWQWDDTNQTDLPYATTTVNAGTDNITLDPTHYEIDRIEMKLSSATAYTKLIPFDVSDPVCLDAYNSTTQGTPVAYDKMGVSLIPYPVPSQSMTMRLFYRRGTTYFITTDTTKTPGFNPLFHRLLSLWSAYDYAFINQLANKNDLRQEITVMESALQQFYNVRDKDDKISLKARQYNFR